MKKLLLPVSILLACAGWWAFSESALISLHKRWWTIGETYEIGYPLLAIACYWVFMQRARLRNSPIKPSPVGISLFIVSLLLSAGGRLVQLQIVQQLMIPVSLWCGLFTVLGWRIAAQLILPCALLLAGVPVWDFLVDPLRKMTVAAVQLSLGLVDVPALVQGYHVILPGGVMMVEDACSGLNLLLAALVLSVLHAQLSLRSSWRKLLVIAIGVAIGIIDNWIRVFGLVAIAFYSNMQSSLVYDHATFGWWLFVISLVPFFFIARVIERREQRTFATVAAAPDNSFTTKPKGHQLAQARMVITAFSIALVSGALYVLLDRWENTGGDTVRSFSAPASASPTNVGWRPQYSGYDTARSWLIAKQGMTYEILALAYNHQQNGKKLIYYTNRIAEQQDILRTAKVNIDEHFTINETVIREHGSTRIVWWFYWIDGAVANDAMGAKLLQLRAIASGDRSATLVAVSKLCFETDCTMERERAASLEMRNFLKQLSAP